MNAAARQFMDAAFQAAAALDATITADKIAAALDALENGPRTITDAKPLDRVLREAEVAQILNCSTRTVRRLGKRGKIRAVRFGDRIALGYSAASVDAAIKAATANG